MIINMFWVIFFLALGGLWALDYLWGGKHSLKSKKKLPPGPSGWPIIGNLHVLGELPHHDLHKLAKQYGPIMYLRLGSVPTIVISSPLAAEQFFKVHDLSVANRPSIDVGKHIGYGFKGLSLSNYGSYWRNIRKLCTIHLLSQTKIESFRSIREEELGFLVKSLRDSSTGHMVDLSVKVSSLTSDIVCRMMFNRKYTDDDLDARGFRGILQEVMKLATTFNMADYMPYVGVFDLQGLVRRMKAVSKVLDAFLEKIIDEHIKMRASVEGGTTEHSHRRDDFVDTMLFLLESNTMEFQIDRTNIKAILLDIFGAAIDTSIATIEWTLSELLRNPHVMKKVQEELERVVGKETLVEESDLVHLEYMEMVVKESMRLHPASALPIPHEAIEDCEVNGYHIPKKSRIITNIWAIGRDSNAWVDAEKFYPERFIGTSIDLNGNDFQLIPFGSGRRGCPGKFLGLALVRLVVAQLVHCFDWELPFGTSPSELDMTEAFGLTVPRATHLLAIPSFRLCDKL